MRSLRQGLSFSRKRESIEHNRISDPRFCGDHKECNIKKKLLALILLFTSLVMIASEASAAPFKKNSLVRTKPSSNAVSLTFDDGPDPRYTPKILAILKKYHIKTTFFVMGAKAQRYPELIKKIQADGHNVENHTYTHPKLTKISDAKMQNEIHKTNEIIFKLTGRQAKCLRPPFGLHNKRIDAYANLQGLKVVMWDWNSFDYKGRGSRWLTQWVLSKTRPGYVLLLHDGSGKSYQTVQALPAIIEGLRKHGLHFEPICQ